MNIGLLAALTFWSVDPMSETQYLPDTIPEDGVKNGVVQIIAARDEYEPGSFVVRADRDLGKVKFVIGELKTKDGKAFPADCLDLKTVKVWYQNGNAWFSYFADKGKKLCPELLLNDEDLIKVDEAKKSNYARLTEKDGRVHYTWLSDPAAFHTRSEDITLSRPRPVGPFVCMRENFSDAQTHAGATLAKDKSKQFFLTAHVKADQPVGIYRGEIALVPDGTTEVVARIPVALRVLPFTLPDPMCWNDVNRPFITLLSDYGNLDMISSQNGGDRALARRQLISICRDFAAHGQTQPSFGDAINNLDIVRAGGQRVDEFLRGWHMKITDPCEMRAQAKRLRRKADKVYGKDVRPFLRYGDEYGLKTLRTVRPMVEIYQRAGFRWVVNSKSTYGFAAVTADLLDLPIPPDSLSMSYAAKFNDVTGNTAYFGWYAQQHVGVENPAFCRRQYGFGPYRAGFSCNHNYAHHLDGWNDSVTDIFRRMQFVYGCGSGCIDTLSWEAFREGLDDIRYATVLKRLALPHLDSRDIPLRTMARKAIQLMTDADQDNFDLTTLRREMTRHILNLMDYQK